MGKILLAIGGSALTAFSIYIAIAIAYKDTEIIPWYLPVALGVTVLLAALFVIFGAIYLIDLINWKLNPVRIQVDTSIGKSNVTQSAKEYQFKVTYSLETRIPPIQISNLQLRFRSEVLKSSESSFKLDKQKEIFESSFILTENSPFFGHLLNHEKYLLSFVAQRKTCRSKEFLLTKADVLIAVPTAKIAVQMYAPTVTTSDKNKETSAIDSIPSHREAVESCHIAWGLWYTGDKFRGDGLFRSGKFKRILLINPSLNNKNIEESAKIVSRDASEMRKEIDLTRQEAERACIPVKFYSALLPPQSFTIFDPFPMEYKGDLIPKSPDAWVCTQQMTPEVGRDLRPINKYENKEKTKQYFDAFFSQFVRIWETESVEFKDIETPYQHKEQTQISKEAILDISKQKSQIKLDIGSLIMEGADVLRAFKSVKAFNHVWPEQEFKVWREDVYDILLKYKLTDFYALFFMDTNIDISQAILKDYIGACEAGLKRLEQIIKDFK